MDTAREGRSTEKQYGFNQNKSRIWFFHFHTISQLRSGIL